jgi:hypothetical protein
VTLFYRKERKVRAKERKECRSKSVNYTSAVRQTRLPTDDLSVSIRFMKRSPVLIAIIILVCTFTNGQQPSTPDDSSVNDGVYKSRFFHFSFTFPKGWVVHGEATKERIREVGKEKITSSGGLTEAEADRVLKNTYQLLTVFQHPLGTPGIEVNPSIQVVAEDVRHAPGITDGRTYLLYIRPMLTKAGGQFIQEQPDEIRVAGRQFFRQDYRMTVNNVSLQQALIVGFDTGYVLAFIFTSRDQAGVEEMLKSLKTVTFEGQAPTKP